MTIVARLFKDRSSTSSLAGSSLLSFFSQVAAKGFFFLTTVYLARKMGADSYGKFAFAFALATVLSVVTRFGIDLLLSRDVAENKQRVAQYFAGAVRVRFVLCLLFLALLFLTLQVLDKPDEVNRLVWILGFAFIFQSLAGTCTAMFEAFRFFGYRSFLNVFLYASIFGCVAASCEWNPQISTAVMAFLVASLTYLGLCAWLYQRKIAPLSLRCEPGFSWLFFTAALPLGMSDLFISVYYRLDAVLLSWMDTDRVVGWYDAAYSFVYALRLLPVSVALVLLPTLSVLFGKNRLQAVRLYSRFMAFSSAAGLILTFLVAAASRPLVQLVYGHQYSPAASVLPVLIWSCALMFLDAFQGIFLIVAERRKALFRATIVGAVSNILLNIVLIPSWSMMGAAVATVISELLVFVICFRYLSDLLPLGKFLRTAARPVLALALASATWNRLQAKGTVVPLIAASVIYVLTLLLLYRLKKPDLNEGPTDYELSDRQG